jgi:hypothetical protein
MNVVFGLAGVYCAGTMIVGAMTIRKNNLCPLTTSLAQMTHQDDRRLCSLFVILDPEGPTG